MLGWDFWQSNKQCANWVHCKRRGQKSPLFLWFPGAGGLDFLRGACSLKIPARDPSNWVKSPRFTNTPCTFHSSRSLWCPKCAHWILNICNFSKTHCHGISQETNSLVDNFPLSPPIPTSRMQTFFDCCLIVPEKISLKFFSLCFLVAGPCENRAIGIAVVQSIALCFCRHRKVSRYAPCFWAKPTQG